ncbi:hypothetical protein XENTR_v10011955 [Xenopus tropicalis]|uniref:4-hydroxyphenylpyruvate dioxygenase n=2 Tax=Xenopus tropicalis TaxID=8364 RepID=A0A803JRC4_XENTR|nr:4-hydroxyphenylpyruvate dioxygenase-like protein isoform X1 [Xenopus tropicalis]XP_031755678.1 4-hydroxyphenylpyruvate dioxygenase-like protein isoform X1 [Xenopus tropicalis]KAE8609940.1 hypothetical protein XENTR_v10011955 [Xenopus tropicalis]KAE8609941.1 hypothetical protein XENTR_v10011955 [Xenopus tropicalis]
MISPIMRLSHVTFQASNALKLIEEFVTKYKFHPFAARGLDGGSSCQVALRNGGVVFMVNENTQKTHENPVMLYDIPLPIPFLDTACNVSFEVEDVPGLYRHLVDEGCQLLLPPTELHDDFGSVTYCIVKSVVGNVSHTLIDRRHYKASFLPGFKYLKNNTNNLSSGNLTHVDHIAYACPFGTSPSILEWYRRCFGFQHFPLYKGEDPERGLEITGHRIGLRLTSLVCPRLGEGCKLVLAESLPQEGINQVDQFIEHHTDGGIQHIGLSTPDIFKAARDLSHLGVRFASQPSSYYSEPRKQKEIYNVGLEPQMLEKFGILIDSATEDILSEDASKKFLLQVFAEPLFSKNSVFLELIERRSAEGFGEGNIRALWRSMQDLQEDLTVKEHEAQ